MLAEASKHSADNMHTADAGWQPTTETCDAQQISSHGLLDIEVNAEGDTWIDDHHTVEDIALAFGGALSDALGDRKGIVRFGDFCAPLDEALVHVVLVRSPRTPPCPLRSLGLAFLAQPRAAPHLPFPSACPGLRPHRPPQFVPSLSLWRHLHARCAACLLFPAAQRGWTAHRT